MCPAAGGDTRGRQPCNVRQCGDIVSGAHAVARDLGIDDALDAPADDGANEFVACDRRIGQPAAGGDAFAARIDSGHDRRSEFADDGARRIGRVDQQGADDDRAGAGVQAKAHVVRRANAAAGLHRHVDGRTNRAQRRLVLAGTKSAVEIDDVQTLGSIGDERTRARDRVVIVARLALRIAAFEPHAAPGAQIDCRENRQRSRRHARCIRGYAAMRKKLSSSRPPVRALFSG
jgi:hypothetical protein